MTQHGLGRRPRPREGEGWAWLCRLPSAWGGRRARLPTAFPRPRDTWALFGAHGGAGAVAGPGGFPTHRGRVSCGRCHPLG